MIWIKALLILTVLSFTAVIWYVLITREWKKFRDKEMDDYNRYGGIK